MVNYHYDDEHVVIILLGYILLGGATRFAKLRRIFSKMPKNHQQSCAKILRIVTIYMVII